MSKKKIPGAYIQNGKKRGEWAELCFAAKGMSLGLALARPWGESNGYDFVVDRGRRGMVRVQVKSTIFPEGTGYSCSLKDSKGPYKKDSFDFVAAYVIPEDLWFILPEKIIRGLWSIGLYPNLPRSKYFEYKEAWHYLQDDRPTILASLEASSEEIAPPAVQEMRRTPSRKSGPLGLLLAVSHKAALSPPTTEPDL